ncbi:MAG: hypothetical protein KBT19_04305 [Lachnospiraceae bacterium]|nr:hypothetical protein [Candidatus Colinaster equi]
MNMNNKFEGLSMELDELESVSGGTSYNKGAGTGKIQLANTPCSCGSKMIRVVNGVKYCEGCNKKRTDLA